MLRIALRVRLRQRLTSFPTASAQDDTSKWRWRSSFKTDRRGRRSLPGYSKPPSLCVAALVAVIIYKGRIWNPPLRVCAQRSSVRRRGICRQFTKNYRRLSPKILVFFTLICKKIINFFISPLIYIIYYNNIIKKT